MSYWQRARARPGRASSRTAAATPALASAAVSTTRAMATTAPIGRRVLAASPAAAAGCRSDTIGARQRPSRHRELGTHVVAVDLRAVHTLLGVLGVARLLVVDEGEAARSIAAVLDHLDALEASVLLEDAAELTLAGVVANAEYAEDAARTGCRRAPTARPTGRPITIAIASLASAATLLCVLVLVAAATSSIAAARA